MSTNFFRGTFCPGGDSSSSSASTPPSSVLALDLLCSDAAVAIDVPSFPKVPSTHLTVSSLFLLLSGILASSSSSSNNRVESIPSHSFAFADSSSDSPDSR